MERLIDFFRNRSMLCGNCQLAFRVDLDWIHRWDQAQETCPGCSLTCENEDAPRVTVNPDDPALDNARVAQLFWYHTSTHPDWPTRHFDPAALLTPQTRRRMGSDKSVAAWAARQRAKALHVGTYEAAIQNMLRRMRDQGDHGCPFYLYRVFLKPSVAVREGWLIDPSNFVGDIDLEEVCPPGSDVARYLNYHEDPGGISLALGREAIGGVQRVPIPLPDPTDDDWAREAVSALESSSDALLPATGRLARFMPPSSPRCALSRELAGALAGRLPSSLRGQFRSAVTFAEGDDPVQWARRTSGLFEVIDEPGRVLAALDKAELRLV